MEIPPIFLISGFMTLLVIVLIVHKVITSYKTLKPLKTHQPTTDTHTHQIVQSEGITRLNKTNLDMFKNIYDKDSKNKIIQNSLSKNPIHEVLFNNSHIKDIHHNFSKRITPKTEITSQYNSGRCWIYSFLNMLRYPLINNLSLPEDFELSQTYLYFYDKLEKSLYFLQNIATTAQNDINSRTVSWLLSNPIGDGGTWNMVVNLIDKYGIVPKSEMPDTYHTKNSGDLNNLLNGNLKRMARIIREKEKMGEDSSVYIQEQIYQIYRILVYFIGTPPTQFTWEYENEMTKQHVRDENLTPLSYSNKYLQFQPDNWAVCGNYPLAQYPFYRLYDIDYCNNMTDGRPTSILNLPIHHLETFAKNNIDRGTPVWVALDWSAFYNCEYSTLDTEVYDYSELDFKMIDKGDSMEYGISRANHAVLLIGYNVDSNGKINRWLIENSHGTKDCHVGKSHKVPREGQGYVTMTSEWFRQYLFQVITPVNELPTEIRTILSTPAIKLDPWESLGCELYCK